jgi:hypothetical protein
MYFSMQVSAAAHVIATIMDINGSKFISLPPVVVSDLKDTLLAL